MEGFMDAPVKVQFLKKWWYFLCQLILSPSNSFLKSVKARPLTFVPPDVFLYTSGL